MSDSSQGSEVARRAGRRVGELAASMAERESARSSEADEREPARLTEEDQRLADRLTEEDQRVADRLAEQDQRDSRRTTPMSFALRADLKDRLNRFRSEGGTINVSGIANDAIERELDRIESGNAVVQRLRVELTERRGPSWTLGYQTGRTWAQEIASWLEITEYATRYTSRDIKVEMYDEGTQYMYVAFTGRFRAPERDYAHDTHDQPAAPSFRYADDGGEPKWEYRIYEMEAYWRAWLTAVSEVYDGIKDHLPPVVDQLPAEQIPEPERPRDVDPDDIPF